MGFRTYCTEDVMAAKENDSEGELRESIVKIELSETTTEEESERPLLDNITQLEGICIFLIS